MLLNEASLHFNSMLYVENHLCKSIKWGIVFPTGAGRADWVVGGKLDCVFKCPYGHWVKLTGIEIDSF